MWGPKTLRLRRQRQEGERNPVLFGAARRAATSAATSARWNWQDGSWSGRPGFRRCTASSCPTSPSSTTPRAGVGTAPSPWLPGSPRSAASARPRPGNGSVRPSTSNPCPAWPRGWRRATCRWTWSSPWRRSPRLPATLLYGRRPSIGACDRLASWRPGTGRRQEAAAEAEAAARAGAAGTDVAEGDADVVAGGSAAREFERRTLRFNDTRRSIWVAFTKDDYAAAKSSLVGSVTAAQREREENGGAAPASDPVGYVPYDQRLYDELMELFQVRNGSEGDPGERIGSPTSRRGACAARTARRLL